jgi:hypothetical protein
MESPMCSSAPNRRDSASSSGGGSPVSSPASRLNAVHPRASLHPTDAGVFLTPGQGFRTGGTNLRMNVGTPRALLRKALGSMAEALERV